jgi:DNA repair exonuclease SbcCD ATPase subunit
MKINKLYIKNYGILEEVTLYPSKVNVLTGDNGNGKSTVSQVIRYLFTNESVGSLKDVVRWGSSKFNIKCEFSHLGKDYVYEVEGGTSTSKLLIVDNERYENSEATKYLASIFNPKLIDYSNFALQDENTNVLFDKPTDRLNNIKSLLNMDFINKAVSYLKERNKNEKLEYEKLESKKNSMSSFEFTLQEEPKEVSNFNLERYNKLLETSNLYNEYIIKKQKLNEYINNKKFMESKLSSLNEELSSIKIERIRFDMSFYDSLNKEVSDLELSFNLNKSNVDRLSKLQDKSNILFTETATLKNKLNSLSIDNSYSQESIDVFNKEINTIEVNISSLEKDLELAEKGECPTCGQEFCIDKNEYIEKINILKKQLSLKSKELDLYKIELKKNKDISKEIDFLKLNITSKESEASQLQIEIKELQDSITSIDESLLSSKKLELSELEIKKKEFDTKKILNEQFSNRKEKILQEINSIETSLAKEDSIELPEEIIWTNEQNIELQELTKAKQEYEKYVSILESVKKFNESILEKKLNHEKELSLVISKMENLQYSIGINTESVKVLDKKYSTYLISKGTSLIQDKMNEYFSRSYGKYSIAIKGDSSQVDFTYSNGKTIAPLIRASGQERDVFGIAFRIALNKLQSTNFFLGDEIDDSASIENSIRMLSNLLNEGYEQVWLVSHKETTKEILMNEFNAKLFLLKEGKVLSN